MRVYNPLHSRVVIAKKYQKVSMLLARPVRRVSNRLFACLCLTVVSLPLANADEVLVAVAANFAAPMREIAERFEQQTGHEITLSFGSSGRFYAQLSNGAPFQLFLSADQEKPQALIDAGLAVSESRFTYALGGLVLWSAELSVTGPDMLRGDDYQHLALANPRLAPYGAAAVSALQALELQEHTRARWVMGENIAQAFQFTESGNAELGLVAMSQVMRDGQISQGSGWPVPAALHQPIRQDAVLLSSAEECAACQQLLQFLRSAEVQETIRQYGYQVMP